MNSIQRRTVINKYIKVIELFVVLVVLPALFLWALTCRFVRKKFDIGIGPEPMINNKAHSQALRLKGYTTETFVIGTTHITSDFDYSASQAVFGRYAGRYPRVEMLFCTIHLTFRALLKYRCVYQYFHGGALGILGGNLRSEIIKNAEPLILKICNMRSVIMPYGSDVHLMNRCSNLSLKNARSVNNRNQRRIEEIITGQIARWSKSADHIIGGCDWVDYIPGWDSLMLSHFAIDTDLWKTAKVRLNKKSRPIRILHAPNHRSLKGTEYIEKAIEELKITGVNIELIILEKVGNDRVREVMESVDIVVDQLLIGWYAMFALEGMSMGKPVICYIRPDLYQFYKRTIIKEADFPIVQSTAETFKDVLQKLVEDKEKIFMLGLASREYVIKFHSLDRVGGHFDEINKRLGIEPCHG